MGTMLLNEGGDTREFVGAESALEMFCVYGQGGGYKNLSLGAYSLISETARAEIEFLAVNSSFSYALIDSDKENHLEFLQNMTTILADHILNGIGNGIPDKWFIPKSLDLTLQALRLMLVRAPQCQIPALRKITKDALKLVEKEVSDKQKAEIYNFRTFLKAAKSQNEKVDYPIPENHLQQAVVSVLYADATIGERYRNFWQPKKSGLSYVANTTGVAKSLSAKTRLAFADPNKVRYAINQYDR